MDDILIEIRNQLKKCNIYIGTNTNLVSPSPEGKAFLRCSLSVQDGFANLTELQNAVARCLSGFDVTIIPVEEHSLSIVPKFKD